jgi:hypothetical protein
MQKKLYPSGHIDIAMSFVAIRSIKYNQGNYDESLELYHQALTIRMKYYPSGHTARHGPNPNRLNSILLSSTRTRTYKLELEP